MGQHGPTTPSDNSAAALATASAHLDVQRLLLVVRAAVGVLTERVPRHHRPAQFQTLGAAAAAPDPQRGHTETTRPPEDGLCALGRSTEQHRHHREQMRRFSLAVQRGARGAVPILSWRSRFGYGTVRNQNEIKTKMKQRPCLRLTTLLFYARRYIASTIVVGMGRPKSD